MSTMKAILEAKEVRLGNLVSHQKDIHEVSVKLLNAWDALKISGIPLTEEWLEKFPKGLELPKWIKFVHQAQNWYYWNNEQKELEIKQ